MIFSPSLSSADAWNDDVAANAVRYAASLFLGRGQYANAEAISLNDIRDAAARLKADNPQVHSMPIISAFDAQGNRTVVTDRPAAKSKTKGKGGLRIALSISNPKKETETMTTEETAAAAKPVKARKTPILRRRHSRRFRHRQQACRQGQREEGEGGKEAAKPLGKRAAAEADAAKGKVAGGAGFLRADPRPIPQEAGRGCRLGEGEGYRRPQGFPDQPDFVLAEGPRSLPQSGGDRA